MLSSSDNERLTGVGPSTPMGELMRRYWMPAAFSDQIVRPDGPPLRVRLLGENLVLFKMTSGRIGLFDERRIVLRHLIHGPHRDIDQGRHPDLRSGHCGFQTRAPRCAGYGFQPVSAARRRSRFGWR